MLDAAIILQIALGRGIEAATMAALLSLNATVGSFEESRAGAALDALRKRAAAKARVLRDGRWRSIDAPVLVPGDVVHLRMGDLSPADVRIGEGAVLLDQSTLTGESAPVEAGPGAIAFAASAVRCGEATGEVAAIRSATRFGRTAELVRTAKATSHLSVTIFGTVRVLAAVDAALVALPLVNSAVTGVPMRDVLPFALVLLVASVPAALPATFTLATALGAAELARLGAHATKLSAIEEAAAMDVLCCDETGTLTQNRLTLSAIEPLGATTEGELLRAAALASDPVTQDPLDVAILVAVAERGALVDPPERIVFTPFDPATRRSLGRYHAPGGDFAVAKGAPPAIIAAAKGTPPDVANAVERLAATGARVLAVARGADASRLAVVGLVASQDPPRPDSAALVAGMKELGIRAVMATGDFAVTPTQVVLLPFANDFVTMSLATDRVAASPGPERWNVRELATKGAAIAAAMLALSFAVHLLARHAFGIGADETRTLDFAMLVATGQGAVYVVRERGHFWSSRPSMWMVGSSLADLAAVSAMATLGILMAPAWPAALGVVYAAVAVHLVVVDGAKAAIFRRLHAPLRGGPPRA